MTPGHLDEARRHQPAVVAHRLYPLDALHLGLRRSPASAIWTCGTQSMLAALEGSLTVSCKIDGADTPLTASQFGAHCAAGILNAACFSPNNYPKTMSQVQNLIAPIWRQKPSSQIRGAKPARCASTSQLSIYNINT